MDDVRFSKAIRTGLGGARSAVQPLSGGFADDGFVVLDCGEATVPVLRCVARRAKEVCVFTATLDGDVIKNHVRIRGCACGTDARARTLTLRAFCTHRSVPCVRVHSRCAPFVRMPRFLVRSAKTSDSRSACRSSARCSSTRWRRVRGWR